MATGVGHRLFRSGFKVLHTEIDTPLAVRRAVCFSEAVFSREVIVEGVAAVHIDDVARAEAAWRRGEIPVLIDAEMKCRHEYHPHVIVDAIIAKRNTGTHREMAPLTIGLGPGFVAPDDVHLAMETQRGHDMGRLIYQGEPSANTGLPGNIAGFTHQRVIRAAISGTFIPDLRLGDRVEAGHRVGRINGSVDVLAGVGGIIRGLLRPGAMVRVGAKLGDIDPRSNPEYLGAISEKARAIGGSVLEGILAEFMGRRKPTAVSSSYCDGLTVRSRRSRLGES